MGGTMNFSPMAHTSFESYSMDDFEPLKWNDNANVSASPSCYYSSYSCSPQSSLLSNTPSPPSDANNSYLQQSISCDFNVEDLEPRPIMEISRPTLFHATMTTEAVIQRVVSSTTTSTVMAPTMTMMPNLHPLPFGTMAGFNHFMAPPPTLAPMQSVQLPSNPNKRGAPSTDCYWNSEDEVNDKKGNRR
jgi:hypothetical protein